ncbi:hypothetical protein LXL04_029644 [Taraxacum kok-saghyz]
MLISPSTSPISAGNSVVEEAFGTKAVGFFLLGCKLREGMVVVGDEEDGRDRRNENRSTNFYNSYIQNQTEKQTDCKKPEFETTNQTKNHETNPRPDRNKTDPRKYRMKKRLTETNRYQKDRTVSDRLRCANCAPTSVCVDKHEIGYEKAQSQKITDFDSLPPFERVRELWKCDSKLCVTREFNEENPGSLIGSQPFRVIRDPPRAAER